MPFCTLKYDKGVYYKEFLFCLTELLPCPTARKNLKTLLLKYPPDSYLLNNNDAFFYSYFIHDEINKIAGKKSVDYTDIKTFYFGNLSQECNDCKI